MRAVWNEFKTFAVQGNVLEMAVGVMVGGASGAIVNSLVNDILMPPIGLLLHRADFSDLYLNLSNRTYASFAEAQAAGAPTLNYGLFANALIDFLIVSICVFFVVRQLNRLRAKLHSSDNQQVPVNEQVCPYCLSGIPEGATRCKFCTSFVRYGLHPKK